MNDLPILKVDDEVIRVGADGLSRGGRRWLPEGQFDEAEVERARADRAEAALAAAMERERVLREALKEAWPYVPDHHGPVQHRIKAALTQSTPDGA